MIVTGGHLRGRKLRSPAGFDVRPTPARVKEALFSILAARLVDARVLDLYAGTGALGLEALSRGAKEAVFVEGNTRVAKSLRNVIAQFALDAQATVLAMRAELAVTSLSGNFQLVFADPPYADKPPISVFQTLLQAGRLAPGAVIIYEHAAQAEPFESAPFLVFRVEKWGEVGMSFLVASESEPNS